MSRKYRFSYLSEEDLIKEVDKYVSQTDLELTIPFDVERYIVQNGGEIIPYKELFKKYGIYSYVSPFSKTIFIDEHQYMEEYSIARFTMAHEWCHLNLHIGFVKEGLGNLADVTIDKWVEFQSSITTEEEKSYEIQANIFAGYMLMPRGKFRSIVDAWYEELGGKVDRVAIEDITNLAVSLVKQFEVSKQALWRQLSKEYPWIGEIIDKALAPR